MKQPAWSPDNLEIHYRKRLAKDDCCWREILSIQRPMTRDEYEKESGCAYQKGALEYEAEYSRHNRALYRIDKRSLLTVFDLRKQRMITCYHKHYLGGHKAGSASVKLENLLEFIDDLEAACNGELEKIFSIKPVTENLSRNQVRKYINPKLKSFCDKCVSEK